MTGREPLVPLLRLDPVEATPGQAVMATFSMVNRGDAAASWSLRVLGLDPQWVQVPPTVGPVAPGATAVGDIVVTLPLGHPPSDLVGSLLATPLDAAPGVSGVAAAAASADLVVSVGDGAQIAAAMEPPTLRGAGGAKFDLVLRNRGRAPIRVEVAATGASPRLRVRFADRAPVLPPGVEVRIRGRVRGPRPFAGQPRRLAFGVRVQGRTTPVRLESSLVQRPVLGNWVTKTVAIVAVVAVWAAVALVGISALSNRLKKTANDKAVATSPLSVPATPSAGAGVAAAKAKVVPGPAKSGAPAGGGSAGGGSAGGGSAGGGSAGGSSSSGGSSSGSSSASGPAAPGSSSPGSPSSGVSSSSAGSGQSAAASPTSRVGGKVNAAQPGGVNVSIVPTSLVDEAAQGANFANTGPGQQATQTAAESTPIGKVYGTLVSNTAASGTTASSQPAMTTTTTPDGSWAFSGLKAPGYYLVTFSKPGYATSKYIVTTTADGKPVLLDSAIGPGNGSVSGSVNGPSGPLGNVDLTITDGTVTLHAKTPTVGPTGSWGVSGLTTPDTYLVTATASGFGTQTTIVTLAAGASQAGVVLRMTPGTGSLTGLVTSARNGSGVGGLTITATDGTKTLSATTTTTSPVGSYTLPNLTVPGTYALTVSGTGWVTQTQQVDLTANAVVNAAVTPASADVTGVITDVTGAGVPDAGVVLSNDTNTYKTLTQSATPIGGYDFGQVPPGAYVLSVTDYGYVTQSAQVVVTSGDVKTVNLSLPAADSSSLNTGVIQGTVTDLFNAKPVLGASLELDHVLVAVKTNSNGDYVIPGVGPGVHSITAYAAGFEPGTVRVSVGLGAVAFAPTILLPILDKVGGIVIDNATGLAVANPVVTLKDSATGKPVGVPGTTPTLGQPAPAQGGFEIDDVPHGNYTLSVTGPPGGAYVPKIDVLQLTLPLDTNQVYLGSQALTLDEAPSYNVITLLAGGSGLPTPVGGVAVTVTDDNSTHAGPITGTSVAPSGPAPPVLKVGPLIVGDTYTATFAYTPTGGGSYTASPVQFTALLNNIAVDTAVIYPTVTADLHVALTFPYRTPAGTVTCAVASVAPVSNPAACPTLPSPSDLPVVTLTGTTGYTFTAPGVPGNPIIQGVTATTDNTGTWTVTTAAASVFLPSQITINVTEPSGISTFAPATASAQLSTFGTQTLALKPAPSSVSGSISPATAVAVAVSPSTSNGVSITASDVSGNLQFNDGAAGRANAAEPGHYSLTFSASGYDAPSQPSDLLVPLCLTGCGTVSTTPASVTLVPHVALTVAVVGSTSPPPGFAGPVAYLYNTNGTNLLASQPVTGSSVVFNDLSVAASAANPLKVVVREAGYKTYTSAADFPSGIVLAQGGTSITDTVVKEGWITGHVGATVGTSTGSAPGVVVTATDKAVTAGCTSAGPLSATTDGSGNYTIVGNYAAGADGGLCTTSTDYYSVAATPPAGYTAGSPVTVPAPVPADPSAIPPVPASQPALQPGDNAAAADLSVTAQRLTVTITVVGSDGKPVPGLAATAFSATGVTATYNGPSTCAAGSTCETVPLSIDPTPYTFNFTAAGYSPMSVGPVPYSPGVAPKPFTVTLNLQQNTINGAVNVQAAGGLKGLNGAQVTLYAADGTTQIAQMTTSTVGGVDGSYQFDSSSVAGKTPPYIPSGNYVVKATLSGYSLSSPVAFATSYPTTIENLTMTVNPVPVTVTVSNKVSADLSGATVTLTQDTSSGAASCPAPFLRGLGSSTQTSTVSGTTASFTSVVPDTYLLNVSGSFGTHPIPAQTAVPVAICPSASTVTESFAVSMARLDGTVNVSQASGAAQATSASVSISASPGTATFTPSVACAAGSADCSQGTYTVYGPLATTYVVHVTLLNYTAPDLTVTPTAAAPTGTPTSVLTANPHTVTITAHSTGSPSGTALLMQGGHVTLNNGTHTYTGTTGTAIPNVVPSNSSSYAVTVTSGGVTLTGTLTVAVTDPTADSLDVTGAFGQISGNIAALTPSQSSPTSATVCAACTGTPTFTAPLSGGSGSFLGYLAPGTYATTIRVGSLTTAATSIVVTDGSAVSLGATALTIQAQDASAAPIGGASLSVTVGSAAFSATTDKSGYWAVLVPSTATAGIVVGGTSAAGSGKNATSGTISGTLVPGTPQTIVTTLS